MKNSTIKIAAILSILSFSFPLFSQIDFGVKAGLHSYDIPSSTTDTSVFSLNNVNTGFHIGTVARFKLFGLFVEPGLQFNNIVAKYTVVDSTSQNINESFVNLDVPLMFGYKLFFLNVHGGPVAHIRLSDYGELLKVKVFKDKLSNAFWGVQLGASFQAGSNIFVELKYEKNFNKDINDSGVSLVDRNARILASLGYYF